MANILTDPPFAAESADQDQRPRENPGLVAGILGVIGSGLCGLVARPVIFALNNAAAS